MNGDYSFRSTLLPKLPGFAFALAISMIIAWTVRPVLAGDNWIAGTFHTGSLVVDSQAQVGPTAPNPNERVFVKSTATTDTVTMWISAIGTEHIGAGGNNESIPLGIRVNQGFAMGAGGTAVGRGIDLDSTCSKSSGTGTLECDGILIAAHGGDTNNAIHVLANGGGIITQSAEGLAVTAGPTQLVTMTASDTVTANKASGTALSVPNAAFSLAQNGTIGTNSSNTVALNSSITTDIIMTTSAADQIFRMTNSSAGGHNFGYDNGGTGAFFGAGLTLYDNTSSAIAWQVDTNQNFKVPNGSVVFGGSNAKMLPSGVTSPEGVVTGNPGDLYSDTSAGELYIKHTGTGNTGWVIVTHS